MNNLPREKQIEVIAALRRRRHPYRRAPAGVNRGTVGSLALRVGLGCIELNDRLIVGIRTERLDEAWSFVAKKQKNVKRHEIKGRSVRFHRHGRNAEGHY